MKPLVPYHGGKGRIADWIVGLMPSHRIYVEPFAGSAAVLLAKPRSTHEILNDLDRNLVAFYRVLRDQPEDLERACRLTPYARDEFVAADLSDGSIDDLERARRWWIRTTQGFGSFTKPVNGWALSSSRGGADAGAVRANLERFAHVAARLSFVAIENRDALEVITAHDSDSTVIYADPPYLDSTRAQHSAAYGHELLTEAEHRDLAAALHACSATVLLSGYASPLYDELYAGWPRAERRILRRASNNSGRALDHRVEVVWSNRPLHEDLLSGLAAGATS